MVVKDVGALDADLARWDSDLANALRNLLALRKMFAFECFFAESPTVVPTGKTKVEVEPLQRNFNDLWQHFQLIQSEIARAKALRQKERWISKATLAAIDEILNGSSLDMPDILVPLEQRGLLTPASAGQTKASCTELMRSLATVFEQTRKLVFDIQKVWDEINPRLDSFTNEAAALKALAAELHVSEPFEVVQLNQRVTAIHSSLLSDPLGCDGVAESELQPLVERARAALKPLKEQRDKLVALLREAEAGFDALKKLHEECEANRLDALDAIVGQRELPRSTFALARLREWFGKIKDESATNLTDASQKFTRWKAAMDEWTRLEDEANKAYKAALEERNELKTRLRCYRDTASKGRYDGRSMLEDPELIRLGHEADERLARPCDVARARESVDGFRGRLRTMEVLAQP
jgi:hypothetical protein